MTAGAIKETKDLDEQLAALVASSNTIEVLTVLTEREASPKQIAEILGLMTQTASYHVGKLVELGMVELVEERDMGGVIQHIYRAVVRPVIGNDEWQKLSVEERQRFSIWIVQLIIADAARSFDAALFNACAKNHLSRMAMVLDREGFEEVAQIQDRALAELYDAQARSAERVATGGGTTANVVAAMMCFEAPEGVRQMKVQEVPSTVPAVSIVKSN